MATQTQTAPDGADNRVVKETADSTTLHSPDMRCPDPSVHQTKSTTLQDHASAAALYSTNPAKANAQNPLGSDGRLSSASAATSLKQAQAHELPSFPVVGIDTRSSAGTAATLANANKKSPEWWKPEQSAAAGKAALLANDYKMAPSWQPEASAAGSKAALLAHKEGGKSNTWTPEASAHGHSAATIAMSKKGLGPSADWSSTEEGKRKALVAAGGAVSTSGRKRAQSTPAPPVLYPDAGNSAKNALTAATLAHTPSMKMSKSQTTQATPPLYPDAGNSAKNALSAATIAHTPSMKVSKSQDSNRADSNAMRAARIQHSKVSPQMYTERPPVALEVEEKKRQDALKASAISMAKKMYDVQQQHIDRASGRSAPSHAQTGATAAQQSQQTYATDDDIKEQAMRYIGIQEAAQKLAAERLAKIGPDANASYRDYYGYEKPSRNKLSIRRGRNRASSNPETGDSSDDEFQSRRIRSQMSQLNKSLAEVDAKKRDQDRKHLLAAAERKVQAQMLGLDKKIFDETGKMSPAMIDDWDSKARAKAAADSEARMENHGRVNIGNGKYMDQAEIDAIAQARIQPTLDEIAEKTEKRRAEEEEQRLEMEEKKRQTLKEKEHAAELKAEERHAREEEKKALKAKTAGEKAAAKHDKEAEKGKRAEEKRLAKDEKHKTKETDTSAPGASAAVTTDVPPTTENEDLYRDPARNEGQQPEHEVSNPTSPTSPTSSKSESKGLKSFLNKFKRRSKHSSASAETDKPGFIGGVALRNSESRSRKGSAPASPQVQTPNNDRRYSDVSSLSSVDRRGRSPKRTTTDLSGVSGPSDPEEARDAFNEDLAPPPSFTTTDADAARKGSPNRDSRFHEVGI